MFIDTVQPTGADCIGGLKSQINFFANVPEQRLAGEGEKVGLKFRWRGMHAFPEHGLVIKSQSIKLVVNRFFDHI